MSCQCPHPRYHPDTERKPGSCVQCARLIPSWALTDKRVEAFYRGLEHALSASGQLEAAAPIVAQARARLDRGRRVFGNEWLDRDNPQEATEEYADAVNYAMFTLCQVERLVSSGVPVDVEAVTAHCLDSAYHASLAHAAARRAHTALAGALAPA